MDIKTLAEQYNDYIIDRRRYYHTCPELSGEEKNTRAHLKEDLEALGITDIHEMETCYGLTATIHGGKPGKTVALRADIDALPVKEETGLPFASHNEGKMHACGHDNHMAMLLGAAKILNEVKDELSGDVRLVFQPAEETFEGARDMLENGLLENPPVDAALAYHVAAGKSPVGFVMYNDSGVMMASVDGFEITVHGRGSHGANPNLAIDPINVGVHSHLALQELIARESDPTKTCVLTIGQFMAGTAANIIPDTAVLRGTIRTNDKKARALLVRRMRETAERTAAVYNATVEIRTLSEVCPLVCDKSVTDDMLRYMGALNIPNFTPYGGISATGSEDFALVAERVPSAMMYLGAGYMDERGQYTAHNPKVVFNEGVLPIGAACMAHCAVEWLKENA